MVLPGELLGRQLQRREFGQVSFRQRELAGVPTWLSARDVFPGRSDRASVKRDPVCQCRLRDSLSEGNADPYSPVPSSVCADRKLRVNMRRPTFPPKDECHTCWLKKTASPGSDSIG